MRGNGTLLFLLLVSWQVKSQTSTEPFHIPLTLELMASVNGKTIDPGQVINDMGTPKDIYLSFEVDQTRYKRELVQNFKYRLSGLVEEWQETDTTVVVFRDVLPGDYVFQVVAVDSAGRTASHAYQRSFRIVHEGKPPFLSGRPWVAFRVLGGGLLLVGLGWSFFQFKINNKKQKELLQKNYQLELSVQGNQILANKLVPLFISNILNNLQSAFEGKKTEETFAHINQVSRLMYKVFEFTARETVPLTECLQFFEAYLRLKQKMLNDGPTLEYLIEENLKTEKQGISLPPLVLQPLVDNLLSNEKGLADKIEKLRIELTEGPGLLKGTFTLEARNISVDSPMKFLEKKAGLLSGVLETTKTRLQYYATSLQPVGTNQTTHFTFVQCNLFPFKLQVSVQIPFKEIHEL